MDSQGKRIYLSSKLKKSISLTSAPVGYIYGWETDSEIYCQGISSSTNHILPGLEIIGLFCQLEKPVEAENEFLNICEQNFTTLKLELENPIVLFVWKEASQDSEICSLVKLYSPYYSSFVDLTVEEISYNPAVLVRARGHVPLVLEMTSDSDTLKENIEVAMERLRTVFQSQVAAFLLRKSNYMLHSLQEEPSDSEMTCKDLLKSIADTDTYEKSKFRKNMQRKHLDFDILIQTSGDAALENTFNHSIVIHCQRREFKCASLSLPLDVIVISHESESTSSVYKLLQIAVDQQLMKINQCLQKYAELLEIVSPVPHHFYPDIWEFPVTLIYPSNKTDKELESYRKELHKELLLPLDRPFLKKLNACDLSDTSASGHLINPHEGLTSSGVVGGKVALVQGKYNYHHYMQDHVNDNGWGCAYRSLQTIVSWFRYQGYTDRSVPTHKEIQEALVAVGDKPQTFIGSNKWIGSQEVSFCLDHLIQVQSKIMFVSSGAEMASKGRELFHHFCDQGTPVMIGGGVLAHTILGVDFNQDTGELKFLILDPHYTGSEDLNVVLNKGWCGWKGVQFWDQTAFYNLCLPQRPLEI